MKNILITGASTGIGLAIVKSLASEGYNVYAGVRKESDFKNLNLIENVTSIYLDVTNQNQIEDAKELLEGKNGISILINNAGLGIVGPIFDISVDDLKHQFDVNVYGVLRIIKAFKDQLISNNGHIINVSSLNGHRSSKFGAAYNMSKYAIEGLSETLMLEGQKFGINVSIVNPGQFKTQIFEKMKKQIDEMHSITKYYKEEYKQMSENFDPSQIGRDTKIIGKEVLNLVKQENPIKRLVSASDGEKLWMLTQMVERLDDIVKNNTDYSFEDVIKMIKS